MRTVALFALLAMSPTILAQPEGHGTPTTQPVKGPDGPTSSSSPDWAKRGTVLPAITNKATPVEKVANQSPFTDEVAKLSLLEQAYQQHVTTLSNPFFEGRAPGTRGAELAAEYIEFWMKGIGLEPAFPADSAAERAAPSYRQYFSAGREAVVTRAEAGLNGESWREGEDFNVLGTSGNGEASGPVVFVGYGIAEGPEGYSSFEGMAEGATLEGKIAVMLRFEPMDEKGRSRWSKGGGWTNASALRSKLAAVAKRKPAAIVMINPPGVDDERAGKLEDAKSTRQGGALDVPIIMMSGAKAEKVAAAAGTTLMALRQAADTKGGVTELKGASLRVAAAIELKPVPACNVAGLLRGQGALANEYLVIGGHYDHLGYGSFGSRAGSRAKGLVHNGADDNASGTSGVLLAAQVLSDQYRLMPAGASARSIIFIAFSGEESGLLGSRFFTRHAPMDVKSISLMLNMDMIGRIRSNKLDISGTGSAEGLEAFIKPMVDESGLTIRMLPGGSGPSDHASFYGVEVPVLALFSGMHTTYHMPEDLWWQINPVGATKAVNLLTKIATAAASSPTKLVFKAAEGPSIIYDDPSEPSRPAPSGDAPRRGPVRVRFGIAPDNYDDGLPGVPVGEVYPGTSAGEAGIKAGDRLVKWNGEAIKDVEGWMTNLSAAKPGDVVEVEISRDGKPITLKVTLKPREEGAR